MTYKQYKFLVGLHKLSPRMNNEQKYNLHSSYEIERITKFSEEEVLTIANELAEQDYVSLAKNSKTAKERRGYIHAIAITYSGVIAKNSYIKNITVNFLKNIIVPAVVSIICSLIVNHLNK